MYKWNEHLSSQCPAILLPKCEPVFKKNSTFVATSNWTHYITSGGQQEG